MKDSFYLAYLSCSTWAKIPWRGHESPLHLAVGQEDYGSTEGASM